MTDQEATMPDTAPLALNAALAMVAAERAAQDAKWGANRRLTGLQRLAILSEEFGEVAALVTRAEVPPEDESNAGFLLSELVQVAAVAVAWVQAIDGGNAPVVERDDKAELVKSLRVIGSRLTQHPLLDDPCYWSKLEVFGLVEAARAALAAVGEEP